MALLLVFLMFPLKVFGYNPLSANNPDRLHDIVTEAEQFDFLLLAGTAAKRARGEDHSAFRVDGRQVISSGYVEGNFSNKACGVSIIIGKKFAKARVHPPIATSGKLGGRGLAVRVSNGYSDFTPIVLYYPPVPWDKKKQGVYRECCKQLTAWCSAVLDKVPSGSTPIIFADVNDGLGVKTIGGIEQLLETTVVSESAARHEKLDGGAGEFLRALLESHGLASASSWYDPRSTYFGNSDNSSLIDHIFIPWQLIEGLRSGGPLHKLGSRLQLIIRQNRADHVPVHMVFWYLREHVNTTNASLLESPQYQVSPALADA